ncbi:hypothetical protein [Aquibacillus sediminis]|uniref:hypothetical protein n=1 Tax=Aquibacillus sediminis TaxID=2574734 RepID=UPI0011091DD6|nr:hypothetical protein [Aquibacillus sediminis]
MEHPQNDILQKLEEMNHKLDQIESRLARLEIVDSIEHRVTVNQIDITDIKELLEKNGNTIKLDYDALVGEVTKQLDRTLTNQFHQFHRRLDSQLLKIAKAEEDILMLKADEE